MPLSWPGLSRPSTSSSPLSQGKKDVDARDKRGHDESESDTARIRPVAMKAIFAAIDRTVEILVAAIFAAMVLIGFFQVFTGEVCQVTQVETSSVTLPSQVNFVPSKVAPLSSSGLMPVVRRRGFEPLTLRFEV